MEELCLQLRKLVPQCNAYVLANTISNEWQITSTKLIELRNISEFVIVIFLPPTLRTSAEDSFDVSTFERYVVGDLYKDLRRTLMSQLPLDIGKVAEQIISNSGCKDDISISKYLLEVIHSDGTDVELGLALFHLHLIPDPSLLSDPQLLYQKIVRNKNVVDILSAPDRSIFEKIQKLQIREGVTTRALYQFFNDVRTFVVSDWLPEILNQKYIEELRFDRWEFQESSDRRY